MGRITPILPEQRRFLLRWFRVSASRVVLLIAVAGCAGDRVDARALAGRAAPAEVPRVGALAGRTGPAEVPTAGATQRLAEAPSAPGTADVTVAEGTPFVIRRVERLGSPGGGLGAFDVAYTVRPHIGAPAHPDVRARVTCQIHDLLLVVEPAPEEIFRGSGEARLATSFRPDPFDAAPGDCEVAFLYRGAPVGKACLHEAGISDGGCLADGAPRAAVSGVAMARTELAVRGGVVSASAVLTVSATRAGHAARLRCDDGGRVAAAPEPSLLPALDGIAPGTSRYVQLTAELAARIGSARSRCEVAITAGGSEIARHCLSDQRAEPGACTPALGHR